MSFRSWPRAGAVLTLGLTLVSCGGGDGPKDPVSFVEIAPKSARMYSVGQQTVFTATITTESGGAGEGVPVAFKARDETLIQVNSAGVATALKKGGSTYVVATAGGKSDSALVEVPTTTCGSTTPTAMTIGQVVTDIGSTGFCATASTGDYAVIVHSTSLAASGSSSVEINGAGIGTLPGAGANLSKVALDRAAFGEGIRQWRRDVAAEMQHRRREALEVTPLARASRAFYDARPKRATLATAAPAVGDIMRVNVNITSACTDSTPVDARVVAVSNSAIVLADPRNPSVGGYTDEEYATFAQTFDNDINPVDVANFGAPTDLDANSRIILVFTKAVNERTPAGADYYIGGLTYSRDLVAKASCKTSNYGEMFYLLVPDSLGVVNNNKFYRSFVSTVTNATIAHEYQHLINFARRTYLNGAAQPNEELWLNEALAHMAEELLFYRRASRTPRTNFGGADLTGATIYNQWVSDAAGDFINYDEYAFRPSSSSPFSATDDVSTRGASWALLRYLADQTFSTDGNFWYDLVNQGDVGVTNVQKRLGNISTAAFQAKFRDFVVSVYTDDFVSGVDAKYSQPSWNMRSFYPRLTQILGQNWVWPLSGVALKDTETKSTTLTSGAFQVYRFRGLSGSDSFIRVTGSSGGALPSNVTISVVRVQ